MADVDQSLLDWFATLTPLERLQLVSRQTRILWLARASADDVETLILSKQYANRQA